METKGLNSKSLLQQWTRTIYPMDIPSPTHKGKGK